MNVKERQALATELKVQGYTVKIDKWPRKATYYKPDGEAMPNLPADPWNMTRYLKRGFTLVPPDRMPEKKPVVDEAQICEVCGFEAKSTFGLQTHMRTHKINGGKQNGI